MEKDKLDKIIKVLDEKKAESIELFDLSGSDYFVDYVIIATTLGDRHGSSLLDYVKDTLRVMGEKILNTDTADEWIVIDVGDLLIHLMSSEYRAKYNIEEFLQEYGKQKEE